MKKMVEEIKTELLAAYKIENIVFTIGNTPDLKGDKVMLNQVFTNLLGNAVKYSSRQEKPVVSIEGQENGQERPVRSGRTTFPGKIRGTADPSASPDSCRELQLRWPENYEEHRLSG